MFDEEAQSSLRQHLPNGSYLVFILLVGVMAGLVVWSVMSSARVRAAAEDRDTRGQLQTELRALVGARALAPAEAAPAYGVPVTQPAARTSWKWLGFIALIGIVFTLWATINHYVASTVEIEDAPDAPPPAPEVPRVPLVVIPEWMKVAVRSSRDGIIGLDSSGRIMAANPAAEKLLGCESGKLPGQKASDFLPEIGQNSDGLRRFSQVASATPVTMNRKDGTSETIQVALQRVSDKGDTQYVVSIFQPVAMPVPAVPVAPEVPAPVAALAVAAEPVESAASAPARPAVNLDALHDLENQVVMLSGYSELVVSGLPPAHPSLADAEAVSRAAARAGLLCHEVAPIAQPHPQSFDLNAFVQAVAGPLSRVLDEGCEVRGLPGQTIAEVWADPDLLERSLCSLAWRTQELTGGLRQVSISVSNGRLDLRMSLTGVASAATAAAYDALQAIDWIEIQNGTIEMEERSETGVRFRIWLPAAAQPRQSRVPDASGQPQPSSPHRHAAAD